MSPTEVLQLINNHEVENGVKFVRVDEKFNRMISADIVKGMTKFSFWSCLINWQLQYSVCRCDPDSKRKGSAYRWGTWHQVCFSISGLSAW